MSDTRSSSSVIASGAESRRKRRRGRYRDGLDHTPGACCPLCSRECYRAKLRSVAFTLPASFRAAR
jgi:hypothetical protein